MYVSDPDAVIDQIKTWVISEFNNLKEKYALGATSHEINVLLNGFDGRAKSIEELESGVSELKENVDATTIYQKKLAYAEKVINNCKYEEILKIFCHKGLLGQVGKWYDLKPNCYAQKVKDIIMSGKTDIIDSLKSLMPTLE
jgi:hypothetical protein